VKRRHRNGAKKNIADVDYERTEGLQEILLTELVGDKVYKV